MLAFYELFAACERTVSFFSQGINQSATGTDKANAIINCHLATGRLGKPGAGPFSITGQPNAMGGREVGGLANQLAAHMDFTPEAIDRVARFWKAPMVAHKPGLKAVDLFEAMHRGEIRFVWIMATNPAVSLPDSTRVREALERCDTVVVSDCMGDTDTAAYADVLLPAAGWGEKEGTVTNSERVISRQRAFRAPAGEALPDWKIVCEVARRLGYASAFAYGSAAAIFREHAALSAFENNGARDFDIGALAQLSDDSFDRLEPVRWPCPAQPGLPSTLPAFHDGAKMRMVPVVPEGGDPAPRHPKHPQLLLNTGRLRDQWHTMTRTGLAPVLNRHQRFFSASLHPATARSLGIEEGALLRIRNQGGDVLALATLDPAMDLGAVFLPIHWSDRFASSARVSALLPPVTDPVSGQPASKYAWVGVEPMVVGAWCLLASRRALPDPESETAYWSRVRVQGGEMLLLADAKAEAIHATIDALFPEVEVFAVSAQTPLQDRRVWFDQTLAAACFTHAQLGELPDPGWLERQLSGVLSQPAWSLLKTASAFHSGDRLVCSCHEVGEKAITEAIRAGAGDIDALGKELRCGTGCGSCLPELKALIDEHGGHAEGRVSQNHT